MSNEIVARLEKIKSKLRRAAVVLATGAATLLPGSGVSYPSNNSASQSKTSTIMEQEKIEETISQICQDDYAFSRFCEERSKQVGSNFINRAKEIHRDIDENGADILKERWGKDVTIGFHCIRSACETLTEAAKDSNCEEFIDGFTKVVKRNNPNGVYGAINPFYANDKHHPHAEFYYRGIGSNITEQTKNNPFDIFMLIHDSKGNTSSGYHAVIVTQNTVVSFNSEKIVPVEDYCKNIKSGFIFNISQIVCDSEQDMLRQCFNQEVISATQDPQLASEAMRSIIGEYGLIKAPIHYTLSDNKHPISSSNTFPHILTQGNSRTS